MKDEILKIIHEKFLDGISCIFITGKAGTGKSTLLKAIVADWESNYVVLAPTGVAALNVGGETIHSFFRIRPGILPSDAIHEAHKQNRTSRASLYKALEYLIIDEVSMVRADLMDTIDVFLKTIRNNTEPFGGVKVILFGDMFQLPPVVTKEDQEIMKHYYDSEYFFSSFVISGMLQNIFPNFTILELEKVYRQSDQNFVNVLNKIRSGKVEVEELELLNARYIEDDIPPNVINLVTTNYKAENINGFHLTQIEENPRTFYAQITGDFDEKFYPNSNEMKLKLGARVMFIVNDKDDRWVNGTTGTVVGFGKSNEHQNIAPPPTPSIPTKYSLESELRGSSSRVDSPLSRHLRENSRDEGAGGGAELRTNIEGWEDFDFDSQINHPEYNINGVIVKLDDSDKEVFVEPHTWEISKTTFDKSKNSLQKDLIGTYTQLPFIYAWAITIHKSQGKTFDDVVIDLQHGSFAHGQTYVALSRCRSLGGIRLLSKIKPRDIIVDDRIVAFFENNSNLISKF